MSGSGPGRETFAKYANKAKVFHYCSLQAFPFYIIISSMGNSASLPQSGKSFESQSSHMKSIFEGQQPESYLKLKHRKFSKSDSNINSPALSRRRRAYSAGSEEDPWGWFEDFESPNLPGNELSSEFSKQPLQKALTLPPPVSEPPVYILESSLHTQQLWYSTAGQRPRQPASEREYFEKVWMKNFEESKVQENLENLDSLLQKPKFERGSPTSNREVLYRGKGPFSNSVSKSFADHRIACMTLQLPRFRVSKGEKGEYFAEFLVVVSIGHHGAATFGVWRRHCDFKNLVAEVLPYSLSF